MPLVLRTAVGFMIAALALYTTGVWGVVLGRRLRPWHAALFWLGFSSDAAGTELMRRMAGGFHWSLHTATGVTALLLMAVHAAWATGALIRRDEALLRRFYRISLAVWLIWLVPFVTGLWLGRQRGG